MDCPPKPGCITVNVGDPLQFWSDGLLKSNYHRVRMPKEGEPLVRPSAWPNTLSPAPLLALNALQKPSSEILTYCPCG